jgi:sortase A
VIAQKPLWGVLRWTKRVLFAGAVVMLSFCLYVAADAWHFQRDQRARLEHLLQQRQAAIGSGGQDSFAPRIVSGGLMGRIDIPRLGLSVIVIEGVDHITLRHAVGHIPGTALPGQPGNVGISGHRDTYFRPLRNIHPDDIITLNTALGEYRYRVVSTKVVSPRDIAVLDPGSTESLTLVTCYPFYFVGPAPSRFIVRAERVMGSQEAEGRDRSSRTLRARASGVNGF